MSKNNKRKHLNVRLHEKIKKKYDKCIYCGIHLKEEDRTVDHVIPISKGGLDTEENIVISCSTCNSNKSDYDLEEFLRLMSEGFFEPDVVLKRLQSKIYSPIVNNIKDDIVFEEKVIDIRDIIIPSQFSTPNQSSINSRKKYFLEHGEFKKTIIAEEKINRKGKKVYILRQGYINYIILKEMGEFKTNIKSYVRR